MSVLFRRIRNHPAALNEIYLFEVQKNYRIDDEISIRLPNGLTQILPQRKRSGRISRHHDNEEATTAMKCKAGVEQALTYQ